MARVPKKKSNNNLESALCDTEFIAMNPKAIHAFFKNFIILGDTMNSSLSQLLALYICSHKEELYTWNHNSSILYREARKLVIAAGLDGQSMRIREILNGKYI